MSSEALGTLFVKLVGEDSGFQRMLLKAESLSGHARIALSQLAASAPSAFNKATAAVRGMTGSLDAENFDRPRDALGRFVSASHAASRDASRSFGNIRSFLDGVAESARRAGSAVAKTAGMKASSHEARRPSERPRDSRGRFLGRTAADAKRASPAIQRLTAYVKMFGSAGAAAAANFRRGLTGVDAQIRINRKMVEAAARGEKNAYRDASESVVGFGSSFVKASGMAGRAASNITRRTVSMSNASARSISRIGVAAGRLTFRGLGATIGRSIGLFRRLSNVGTASLKSIRDAMARATRAGDALFSRMKYGIAGIVAATVGISGASSKMASDAAEVDSMFDVVFGQKAEEARKSLEAFGAQVGRSSIDLKTMAANAQGLFVPFGFAREEASEFALALTNLATDLGSFWNMADTDVMENLQSALIGNHEAVRKYGAMISEATLNQKLMDMGIKGGTEAASEQQKVLARLALIMEATKDAQGDATRTAGSHSNQLKSLWATTKDLSIAFGNMLNPAVLKVVQGLKSVLQWTQQNSEVMSVWGRRIASVTETALEYIGYFATAVMNLDLAWETLALTVQQQYTNLTSPIKDWADIATQYVVWFFDNFGSIAKATLDYVGQLFKNSGAYIVDFWKNTWAAVSNMDMSKFNPDGSLMTKGLDKFKDIKGPDIKSRDKSQEDLTAQWRENAKKWDAVMGKTDEALKQAGKDAQMAMPNLADAMQRAAAGNKKKDKELDIVSASEIFRKKLAEQFRDDTGKQQVELLQKQVRLAEEKKKQDRQDQKELVKAINKQSPVGA